MNTTTVSTALKQSEVSRLQSVLKLTYGLVPIVAGADKFTNILTNWSQYLSSDFANFLPFDASTLMMIVGVIEIVAGILVLWKTELGAYVVAAWLVCIALTLILSFNYLDVAVRDIVMAIGAFTLARLTRVTNGSTD
jgi:uncharacterized membrane protein YphA (DoxX/SURF4 family)